MEIASHAGTRYFSIKLALSVVTVVLVSAVAYLAWTQFAQNSNVENKVLAEARTLNVEMQAVWNYIDDSQDSINYNADGTFDFKGIYCSMAGKAIAQRFTRNSDGYIVRYIRENPRSSTDVPDAFELNALNVFAEGSTTEFYALTNYDGKPVFRYVSMLPIKHNCLECHGAPIGDTDITGFFKEGMSLGDIAGAVDIIIPVDSYVQEAQTDIARSVVFFCLLAVAIVLVLFFAMQHWIAYPLERANRQLMNENKQKSDYLAVMSHELRTPLTSIIAYTDIWEKDPKKNTDGQRQFVQEIRQSSSQLLEIVNNTIDVARLDAGRLELQWDEVDIFDVVGEVMSTSTPLAIKKGITLSHDIDYEIPIIVSDEEALRKILLNLVSNAIKFTNPGGSVHVTVRFDQEHKRILMEVEDSGIGIHEEDKKHIFEKYTQVGQTEHNSGSGIGLFLVKELSEQLGGSVELQSEPGKGSVFSVLIPIDASNLICGSE